MLHFGVVVDFALVLCHQKNLCPQDGGGAALQLVGISGINQTDECAFHWVC